MGCPIRKSTLHRIFAPKRGLSQLVTSFIASESQGILHVPFSPFLFFFSGKSPLIILVFSPSFANIPSACEVLICLVDVLFCILIDLLVIIALHKCLLCLAAWLGWFAIACAFALKVTCEVLQFPTCQCSLFFEWRITDSNR